MCFPNGMQMQLRYGVLADKRSKVYMTGRAYESQTQRAEVDGSACMKARKPHKGLFYEYFFTE